MDCGVLSSQILKSSFSRSGTSLFRRFKTVKRTSTKLTVCVILPGFCAEVPEGGGGGSCGGAPCGCVPDVGVDCCARSLTAVKSRAIANKPDIHRGRMCIDYR